MQGEREPLVLHRDPRRGIAPRLVGHLGHDRAPALGAAGSTAGPTASADLLQAVEADQPDPGGAEMLGQESRRAARHHRHHAETGAQFGQQARHAVEGAGQGGIGDDRRERPVEVEEQRR